MIKLKFLFYYFGKLMLVKAGLHQTEKPLDFDWRWKYWRKQEARRAERKALYQLNKSTGWKSRF